MIETLIIDPEIDLVMFDHVRTMKKKKYMEIYGKLYIVEFSQNALNKIKEEKLEAKKISYRLKNPKKERKIPEKKNYYLKKLLKRQSQTSEVSETSSPVQETQSEP
jgi:hypothetical protein